MEYEIFERDFILRTLRVVEQYDECIKGREKYEVTLLINCLLGLLILPKERCYVKIPTDPIDKLNDWGLKPSHILSWGGRPKNAGLNYYDTILEVVHRMRNSLAHLRIRAIGNGSEITQLEFRDKNGFHAIVPVECLKMFVTKLAKCVEGA